ncbi:MAG TPA: methyltransferase domain-containing protein [Kofleriaceae bacterium]|jgi:ubiquinone/menaquinone biosynthesis C-methylase UbiE|nr:methyltransferase domain-containing protein [Kofleriaceae bacterium]
MTTSFAHDSRELAETYDRISDLQFEGGKRLVERLGLQEGARVLDVGCGTGRLAQWIAERVGTNGAVAGIDPLEERIHIARSRGGGTARFEVGQAEDLRAFEDASFDAVCMASVFHWIADKAKALAEVRRVLRPGGRLGMTTLPQELARAGTMGLALESLLARAPYAGRVDISVLTFARRGCTTTELVSLALESRLELVELQVTQRTLTHASGEALVEFLEASSFGNFLRPVPEELRPSLRADLIAAFDARRGPEGIAVHGWGVRFIATRV